MNEELYERIFDRLTRSELPSDVADIVDAACLGDGALNALLGGGPKPARARAARAAGEAPKQPVGTYLKSLSVTGFRGIADTVKLAITPGPGLTLIIGRNGSGKSSLAEGLETLLTGENRRWSQRKTRRQEWEQGWKNLHYAGSPSVSAELVVEGQATPVAATRAWSGDDFGHSTLSIRAGGEQVGGLNALGWEDAITAYRPFLSYNELSAVYEEPSALFDALEGILGMEDIATALKRVTDVRKTADSRVKEVKAAAKRLCSQLEDVDDERAAGCLALLSKRTHDLDAIAALLSWDTAEDAEESDLTILRGLAALSVPTAAELSEKTSEVNAAVSRLATLAGSDSARDAQVVTLLEHAVRFRQKFGDGDCPVCAREMALDATWALASAATIEQLRTAAAETQDAKRHLDQAERALLQLVRPRPTVLERADTVAIEVTEVNAAWALWQSASEHVDPLLRAAAMESALKPLSVAVAKVRDTARTALAAKASVWRPLAERVAAWLVGAREAAASSARLKALKDAEKWLKELGVTLRDERFTPIAEHAQRVWNALRQDSNVALARVELAGTATRRRVSLNVTVDGVDGVALGVMSQGELHALALSLFLPRVALDESPFRFVVIDDPVQSMDPSRVDGLAKVLEEAAKIRQVVVFTHDDRLFEAVRRLQIEADVRIVQRRGQSQVEVKREVDPVTRYIRDARDVVRFEDTIGRSVAERVVPGLCRLALEAGLTTAIRRRRLGRGERHLAVEQAIEGAKKLNSLASLGLFDVAGREGDVLSTINNKFGRDAGDVFKATNAGAHEGYGGDFETLVKQARRLAEGFEALS